MAEAIEKISKVKKVSRSLNVDKVAQEQVRIPPDKEKFDRLMTNEPKKTDKLIAIEEPASKGQQTSTKAVTPIETAEKTQRRGEEAYRGTRAELVAQTDTAVDKVKSIRQTLADNPKAEIKRSVQNVLQNKLIHIDENLRISLAKIGVDYTPPEKPKGLSTPVERFLNYLTHGQAQLETLSSQVSSIDQAHELSAGKVLALQIKVGFIQQELEFFASLLNKTLESTKTLMNVQV